LQHANFGARAKLKEDCAEFAKSFVSVTGQRDADRTGAVGFDDDVAQAGAFGDDTKVARVEDVKMARRIEAEPVGTERAMPVAVGVRCNGDEASAGAEKPSAGGEQGNGIGNVLDHVVEGDSVKTLRNERRGVERPDVDGDAGRGMDARINLLTLDLPAKTLQVGETLAGTATDFEKPARRMIFKVEGVESLSLTMDGGEAEEEMVEAARWRGVRSMSVVILVEAREFLLQWHRVEPEQFAVCVRALADVPVAGNAAETVRKVAVEPASLALTERTTGVIARTDEVAAHTRKVSARRRGEASRKISVQENDWVVWGGWK